MRRLFRVLLLAMSCLLLAAVGGALWARGQMRGSLPQLEGSGNCRAFGTGGRLARRARHSDHPRGQSRGRGPRDRLSARAGPLLPDGSRAPSRRRGARGAGRPARRPARSRARIHRFRAEARRAFSLLRPDDRLLLEAYKAGVNAGLQALSAALRIPAASPDAVALDAGRQLPGRAVDVRHLQDDDGEYEATLATMRDVLPAADGRVSLASGSEWDAPLVGEPFAVPPVPGLRCTTCAESVPASQCVLCHRPWVRSPTQATRVLGSGLQVSDPCESEAAAIGSNNFAVAGRLTADGGALVANDMHLSIRVPNTWYRAALEWLRPERRRVAEPSHRGHVARRPQHSSSAATRTSPGDSPTRTPTGATSCSSMSIRQDRTRIAHRRAGANSNAMTRRSPSQGSRMSTCRCSGQSGDRCSSPTIAAGRAPTAGWRTRPSNSPSP